MKKTLLLFSIVIALASANAQSLTPSKPIILVDSITMPHNILTFIKPDDIKAVQVERSKDNDIVYVTMKDHQVVLDLLKHKMLSLNDLKNTYVQAADRKKPILYVMDYSLLTDMASIRIPATYYHKVNVVKSDDTPYFKTVLPNALIITINTVKMMP